jgi:glycosyltransferase involved in cell wall biosynthesis
MKKLAYIDHSFHQKTKSGDFYMRILEKKFEVRVFWDDSWRGGRSVTAAEINAFDPDIVFYIQTIGKISEMEKINAKNIVWAPMEDAFFLKKAEWLRYKKLRLKILCFSKRTFKKVSLLGFDVLSVQYFIKPEWRERDFSQPRIYFWQRNRSVTWNTVKELLGGQHVERLFFRNVPDPFMVAMPVPSQRDMEQYHIEVSNAWLEKIEMENILSNLNVFIAPRIYEGIGMAFLEAMSRGMAVVASDTPTHNEYIESGVNGYLYDLKNPQQIDFSNLETISKNAFKTASDGYSRWQQSEDKIVDFMDKKSETMPLSQDEKVLLAFASISYLPMLRGKSFVKRIIKKLMYRPSSAK